VELIRSRARDNVDDTAGRTSSLCGIAVGLDRDLLNTFDVRLDSDRSDNTFVVVNSIDYPVIQRIVLSVYRNAGSVSAAIIRSATTAESVTGSFVGAGDELYKLDKVPAVQWKILHSFRGHG
jgi:hypothetical protein